MPCMCAPITHTSIISLCKAISLDTSTTQQPPTINQHHTNHTRMIATGINKCYIGMDKCYIRMDKCYIGMDKCYIGMDKCYIGMDKCYIGMDKCYIGMDVTWIRPCRAPPGSCASAPAPTRPPHCLSGTPVDPLPLDCWIQGCMASTAEV